MTFKVSILQQYFNNYCKKVNPLKPFKCNHELFKNALLYLRCMNISHDIEIMYVDVSYEPDYQSDILPFPFITFDFYFNGSYHVTNPYSISSYKFFTAKFEDSIIPVSPSWSVFVKSFDVQTWLAFILMSLVLYFVIDIIKNRFMSYQRNFNRTLFNMMEFMLCLFVTFMLVLYGSNLKASITVYGKQKPDFDSIEELTSLVESGQKRLIMDLINTSYIWHIISGRRLINNYYPVTLSNLFHATLKNPPLDVSNIDTICNYLKQNPDLVYVGRQTDLDTYCPDDCFWSVDVSEVPSVYRSYIFPNHSRRLSDISNLCVLFMQNNRERQIQRHKKHLVKNCHPSWSKSKIGLETFFAPVCLWIIGLLCATSIFAFEEIVSNYKKSKCVKVAKVTGFVKLNRK